MIVRLDWRCHSWRGRCWRRWLEEGTGRAYFWSLAVGNADWRWLGRQSFRAVRALRKGRFFVGADGRLLACYFEKKWWVQIGKSFLPFVFLAGRGESRGFVV